MKNNIIINAFRRMYEALIPELRKALIEAIVESINKVSGGKGTLDLQEFHMEDGYDDPATVLVEVNRHTGDQANETVDCIVVNNKSGFWIGTENGGINSTYISTEEMLAIYDELSFIEDHIDDPECEFTVEDGKITLKD